MNVELRKPTVPIPSVKPAAPAVDAPGMRGSMRSLVRACAAAAIAAVDRTTPLQVAEHNWRGDRGTQLLLRAPVQPMASVGTGAATIHTIMPDFVETLCAVSAAAQVFRQNLVLSFDALQA